MAAAAFFGHALLGLGPGLAFFLAIISPKSFVVLLSLFSAFLWLVVMLLTSALLRGFVPISATQPAYAGTLLAAVAVEELARYGVWHLHKRTLAVLHRMSESSGHTFTPVDELYLAVGWGYGQAAVHVLILFGSLLPLTAGHGTLYTATCPQMSIFLVAALNSLGVGATLVALSVIALEAWSRGSLLGKAYAPLVHAGAALLTLGSMHQGGCMTAVPAQLALGLVNTWYASSIAWRLVSSSNSSSSRRVSHGGTNSSRDVGLGRVGGGRPAWPDGLVNLQQQGALGAGEEGPPAAAVPPGSPPPVRLPGAVDATLVSPRHTSTGSLRSRAGGQQGSGLL